MVLDCFASCFATPYNDGWNKTLLTLPYFFIVTNNCILVSKNYPKTIMMKKINLLLFLFVGFSALAQENLTYQKPSAEILALADYERAPSVSMDSKKEYMYRVSRRTTLQC